MAETPIEVRLAGIDHASAPWDSQDGGLAVSVNALHERGALRPLMPPMPVLDLTDGHIALYLHKPTSASGLQYLITADGAEIYATEYTGEAMAIKQAIKNANVSSANSSNSGTSTSQSAAQTEGAVGGASGAQIADATRVVVNTPTPLLIGEIEGEATCARAIGNTLVICSTTGNWYFVYKDGAYKALGQKPPMVNISFGLSNVGNLSFVEGDSGNVHYLSVEKDSDQSLYAQDLDDEGNLTERPDCSTPVYALLNPLVNDYITTKGYFWMPFLVRYAYKMFDGTYWYHSSPVLMLPCTLPPFMPVTTVANDNKEKAKVTTGLYIDYFSLDYKVAGAKDLGDWSDIIQSIDVFVTPPIYTYDASKPVTGIINRKRRLKWLLEREGYDGSFAESYDKTTHTYTASATGSCQIVMGHWRYSSRWDGVITRTWADVNSDYSSYKERSVVFSTYPGTELCWDLPANAKWQDEVLTASTFYRIATLTAEDIANSDYKELPLESKDMTSLAGNAVLEDDYMSHARYAAKCSVEYNSRLSLGGVELLPPKPQPLLALSPATAFKGVEGIMGIEARVDTRINGLHATTDLEAYDTDNTYGYDPTHFPRWLYVGDPNAYRITFSYGINSWSVELKPHSFLNGAYYYAGLINSPLPTDYANHADDERGVDRVAVSKVYTSDAYNPWVYPATSINTVGNGQVMALAAATQALSQGQFGQYPLYAFSTDGVWALGVSTATGGFASVDCVSRDVALSTNGVCQLDNAVAFATERGIVMLSGSSTQVLSSALRHDSDLAMPSLPSAVLAAAGLSELDVPAWKDFLAGCLLGYDYARQRLIAYNPTYPIAYVYSLESGMWGMWEYQGGYALNAYPECVAVNASGRVVELSDDGSKSVKTLVVTNPIKLGKAEALKTLRRLFARGDVDRSKCNLAIWGTRDLRAWRLLVSAKGSNAIRLVSGTPWRALSAAAAVTMSKGESLSTLAIGAVSKYGGKLR